MTGDVIEDPAEATPGWLTPRLRASGALPPGGTVTAVRREAVGTGQMGICERLHLVCDGSGPATPGTVIVKLASPEPQVRAFMGPSGYAGEVGFYRDLAQGVGIRMARAHVAAYDPVSTGFTLVLDDLAPARPGDQLEGISLTEAEVCMDELVALHAPRWGDPTLAAEPALAHLQGTEELFDAAWGVAVPIFLDRFGEVVGREGRELLELCAGGTAAWRQRGPSTATLVHGDYRPDNLLIDRRVDPPTVAAVDWQGVRATAGQVDVAFLLATSVEPDELAVHEERLVRRWYDGLLASGVEYDWDTCRADYRWSTVGTLPTTVFGAAFSQHSERGERMFERMISGQVRQILRHDATELLRP